MAAPNIDPLWSRSGDVQWGPAGAADGDGGTAGPLLTANTNRDGTGTVFTVFVADGSNGGFVETLVFQAAGTNVQTVARVFVNNGSTNATAANNILVGEFTLPITTASTNTAVPPYLYPINRMLPPGYKVMVTLGATVTGGYFVSAFGGKY